MCQHGKRELLCKLCSDAAVAAAAATPRAKTFARDDNILESPATPGRLDSSFPPLTPADSLASVCALTSSWTNIDFLKMLEVSRVHGLSPFSFLHPFIPPLLLAVQPHLLLHSQFASTATFTSFNSFQNAPAIRGAQPA